MKFLSFYIICFFVWGTGGAAGNNIKVNGTPELTLNGDTVNITFGLSWENSWRDEFNWDAAWVFVKYKLEGSVAAWNHLNLAAAYEVPVDLTVSPGLTNSKVTGVFIYRKENGGGHLANHQITLKALLSSFSGVTTANVENGSLYVAVSAIEMAYVPYGAYYLGDGASRNAFFAVEQGLYGEIPEDADIVDKNFGYVFTASRSDAAPANAADHVNNSVYSTAVSWYHNTVAAAWWKIDFGTAKTVRFFGVSGASSHAGYAPTNIWYLEGSNDDTDWEVLSAVRHTLWRALTASYPVQQSLKVNKPGAYRYYRLRFPSTNRVIIQNIAMTEENLYPADSESGMIQDDEVARTVVTLNGQTPAVSSIGVNYPKGYNGFYCMKYELSQEQYVSFLNMLSYDQQKARVGNTLDNLERGDYIFGDVSQPSARNGICVLAKPSGKPAIFANNLNPAEPYYGEDDGQTLPCNYLTPADLLAYCDWAGLRPMSELEYEKACRRPYPQKSIPYEYAWNQTSYNRINGLSDLVAAQNGTENEGPQDLSRNVNAGNPSFGPVRCGSFGGPNTTQPQSGSSYWGVMELSGNLGELCYGIGATAFNAFNATNSHGNGTLAAAGTGDVAVAYWPVATTAANFVLRGGSFASGDTSLRVSDRSVLSVSAVRDSTVGIRGVRGLVTATVTGGEISASDTVCWSGSWITSVSGGSCVEEPDLKFTYQWYVKKPGSSVYEIVPGETGEKLWYEDFRNETKATVSYSFKRVAVCLLGVKESNIVTVKVMHKPFVEVRQEFCGGAVLNVTQAWGICTAAQWELEGAPEWAEVTNITATTAVVSGGFTGMNFKLKASLKNCPSDVFVKEIIVSDSIPYKGAVDSVTLAPGRYVVECWGAGGGRGKKNTSLFGTRSNGGYAYGELVLAQKRTFYLYVGGAGKDASLGNGGAGGWNGGAAGGSDNTSESAAERDPGGGGGGASDIRLVKGNLYSRIMVAGGGGGGTFGYSGAGGGGISGTNSSMAGATQTTGAAFGVGSKGISFTASGNAGGGGGGGGYYGSAGGNASSKAAGGGSGFISGMDGCDAVRGDGDVAPTGQSVHYSGIVFTNPKMENGVRSGNGYIRIRPM